MLTAIRSFPNGSSGGIDGLRPQHLKDLTAGTNGVAGQDLLVALAKVGNIMVAGNVPEPIINVLYGASLCALNKKDGGLRPIAVGSVLRRLACCQMLFPFSPRGCHFSVCPTAIWFWGTKWL